MNLVEQLLQNGIKLRSYGVGHNEKMPCPRCSAQRTKPKDACLSVTVDDQGATWNCHHCGWSGGVMDMPQQADAPKKRGRMAALADLPVSAFKWFNTRGISNQTVRKAGVMWAERAWIPAKQGECPSIAFVYRDRDGRTVNAKYRTMDKQFAQVKGGEKHLWLRELCDRSLSDQLTITEGELDALACLEARFDNTVSVPDGAPKKAITDEESAKFEYLSNDKDLLDQFSRINLAVDADEAGEVLRHELARRIGFEKCWLVTYPPDCKDANDVLMKHGAEALARCIDEAQPYPVAGRHLFSEAWDQVEEWLRQGREPGLKTGWPSVDLIYTVGKGQVTIVTGFPNMGKSEWVDALMVNMARKHGWKFGICSFENPIAEHFTKLAEKYLGKPFWARSRSDCIQHQDLLEAKKWIDEHFLAIRFDHSDPGPPTIDTILNIAKVLVLRDGINGLVIDPYNEIESSRSQSMSETEYISQLLGKLRRFAQNHELHIWMVAHPRIPFKTETAKAPSLLDISGSANWANKADMGVVVHRASKSDEGPPMAEIIVRKVRFKWFGRQGAATLRYDIPTGTYHELETQVPHTRYGYDD